MSRRPSRRLRLAALTAALLAVPVHASAAPRHAPPNTHRATCDEIPGENQQVNDRWRIFTASGQGGDPAIDPITWACRRTPRPARRVLELWRLGIGASALVDDIVAIEWSGRYGNYGGSLFDLRTLRGIVRYGDAPVDPRSTLLTSGAIVSLPYNDEGRGETDPIPPGRRVGELTVADRTGVYVIEPGSTWSADAKTFLSLAPAAADVLPFGAGFYYTAADGSLRRHDPAGGIPSTAAWTEKHDVRWRRYAGRVRNRPGVRTTYVGFRELRARAARGDRPASLTLHTPYIESLDFRPAKSDLVARLVPGSEAELQLEGSLVIGRFADRPTERRLRIPAYGKANRFLADLPAPVTFDASTSTQGSGDVVYLDGTELVVIAGDEDETSYTVRRIPAPAGFRDPVIVPPIHRNHSGALLYTGADGTPVRLQYRESDDR